MRPIAKKLKRNRRIARQEWRAEMAYLWSLTT
jgi:hypothetical protein